MRAAPNKIKTKKDLPPALAYGYVRVLFVLEILLFTASLLLHLNVIVMGHNEIYTKYGLLLFRGAVIIGIPTTTFIKESLQWVDQIQSCPKWMWMTALLLGLYAILIACLQVISPDSPSLLDKNLIVSGFPLAFDAISLCILSSVLWYGYLERSEVIRRAILSASIVTFGAAVFLAYRAGYLQRPRTPECLIRLVAGP